MFRLISRKRAIRLLENEVHPLAKAVAKQGDPFRPTVGEQHTRGMYDGLSRAIRVLEEQA